MYDNVPWHALATEHARFALIAPAARKYPADVSPFAGTPDNSIASLRQLASLLAPDEATYVMAASLPAVPELKIEGQVAVLQMFASPNPPPLPAAPGVSIQELSAADAPEMVALTDLAFPGYFRIRTCEMGTYYGIRIGSKLIAMAGERMNLPRDREISGVCTHPDHTGKGYAALLMTRLMHDHAQAGCRSYLHVKSGNARAVGIYQRLGFTIRCELLLLPRLPRLTSARNRVILLPSIDDGKAAQPNRSPSGNPRPPDSASPCSRSYARLRHRQPSQASL